MGLPSPWFTRLSALLRPVGGLTFNPPLPATHVKGGARPSSTDLGLQAQHHIRRSSNSCSPLPTCDLASQRPTGESPHRSSGCHGQAGGAERHSAARQARSQSERNSTASRAAIPRARAGTSPLIAPSLHPLPRQPRCVPSTPPAARAADELDSVVVPSRLVATDSARSTSVSSTSTEVSPPSGSSTTSHSRP